MLEANTDRMWFTIGSILIGAALVVLGRNGLETSFESTMAKVDDFFNVAANSASQNIVPDGKRVKTNEVALNRGVWYTVDPTAMEKLIDKNIEISFEARNVTGTGGHVDGLFVTPDGKGINEGSRTESFLLTSDWKTYTSRVMFTKEVYDLYHNGKGTGTFSVRANYYTDGNVTSYPLEVKNVGIKRAW